MAPSLRKAQSEWLNQMPVKLMLSLTLTPITDKIIYGLFIGMQPLRYRHGIPLASIY